MSALSDIEIFVKVVELANFSRAATELGVSKAHVSQQITNLEKRLNSKLINRTTRKMLLTEVGVEFYERVKAIVSAVYEAEASIIERQSVPHGQLNVSIPPGMIGETYLAPIFTRFIKQYPKINLKLDFTTRRVDLLAENYDLAIRGGYLPDSNLIAKQFYPIRYHLCASPSYLNTYGEPKNPQQLKQHNCLLLTEHENTWQFQDNKRKYHIKVRGNFICNNGYGLMDAAVKGIGIVRLPDFHIIEALKSKALVTILDKYAMPKTALWLVYQQKDILPMKMQLLLNFLDGIRP